MFFDTQFVQNEQIFLPEPKEKNIQIFIKREDLIHPQISGNKFRKLKYNLLEAKRKGLKKLLTFGGAYSNHILATAVAAKMNDFKAFGVIRGDELGKNLERTLSQNDTLREASKYGMEFVFVSREQYRDKMSADFIQSLRKKFGDFHLIPEGGTNSLAIKGCEEILTEHDTQFDYICCCVGTGGTISGLINSSEHHQKVLGFPALKGSFLQDEIREIVGEQSNWELLSDYHFGGYSKYSKELIGFINEFKQKTSIPLDPIYTGKMMFGILDLVKKNRFPNGAKILAIHTGGLQGISGFNQRLRNKSNNLSIDI